MRLILEKETKREKSLGRTLRRGEGLKEMDSSIVKETRKEIEKIWRMSNKGKSVGNGTLEKREEKIG